MKPISKSNLNDDNLIGWRGWWVSWHSLRAAGWIITVKPAFDSWYRSKHSEASREKIYIRHPEDRMLGRITYQDYSGDYHLDYLIQEHNGRVTPPKMLLERDLTVEDVPALLELVLALQNQKLKRKNPIAAEVIHQAEILLMRA